MKNNTFKNLKIFLTFLILGAIALTVIASFILVDTDKKNKPQTLEQKINIQGTYFTDNDKKERHLPTNNFFNLSGYRTVTINGYLDKEIEKNKLILFRGDNLKIKIYINDKLVYDIENRHQNKYMRSPGNGWYEYISPGIKTTDKITFELSNVYTNHVNTTYKMFLNNLYSGYGKDLIVNNLHKNIPNMFISIMIICMGIFVGIYAFTIKKMKRSYTIAITFAWLAITSGLWFFVNFDTHAFLVPYPTVNNTLDFINMMLVAAFLFFNIASMVKNKGRIILDISGSISIITTIIIVGLQFLGIYDVYDFSLGVEILSLIMCIEIMAVLIYELKTNPDKNIIYIFISYTLICLGIILDVICNHFELLPQIFWFKLGFLTFIIVQFILILKSVKNFFIENANIQVLRKERDSFERITQYQALITEATHGLYESVYEIDITNNKANSIETEKYFESLGAPKNIPYDEALVHIANKQIKKEFRENYINVFSPKNILKAYEEGKKGLQYEFMISSDNKHYHWVRITARIFFWEADNSVHIIVYRQNIDSEKKKEINLQKQARNDLLTNLNNKISTENAIKTTLSNNPDKKYAFFIIDIDNFKEVNDSFGHVAGDSILIEFANTLKKHFRTNDIVGRIGGDEFVAFIEISNTEDIKAKGKKLVKQLNKNIKIENKNCHISPSIGISIYPEAGTTFDDLYKNADRALYHTKRKGKNNFTIYKNKD